MRFGRISKAVGVAAAAALALSACAANQGTTDNGSADGESTGGEVRVVEVNAFSSFNSQTANGNVDINSKIAYATHSGFNYITDELKVVPMEDFGTYEKVSEDPLTVKYTVTRA